MKNFLCLLIMLFSQITFAASSNIAALVNNQPITINEVQARKKLFFVLNNIKNYDENIQMQLYKAAINSSIDEAVLKQYALKIGALDKINDEAIDNAIETIEKDRKLSKGYFAVLLKNNNIDPSTFKAQVENELIKLNMLSYISHSVNVTNKEIDSTILFNNSKDAEVKALIFTSKDTNEKTLKNMYSLKKKIVSCENLKPSFYQNFANIKEITQNLSQVDNPYQTILKDLNENESSSIFQTSGTFKLVFLCNKKIINISDEENEYVSNFLSHKKINQKALKMFKDLKKKAYIRILVPNYN